MKRIVVDPEHLRALSNLLGRVSGDIRATAEQLNGAVNGLNADVQNQLGITGEWERARSIARGISEQAETQATYVGSKARGMGDADQESALQIGQLFTDFEAVLRQMPSGWLGSEVAPAVPQHLIGRVAALGDAQDAILPVTALAGLAALIGVRVHARLRSDDGIREETMPAGYPTEQSLFHGEEAADGD